MKEKRRIILAKDILGRYCFEKEEVRAMNQFGQVLETYCSVHGVRKVLVSANSFLFFLIIR